jgi:hypothetical protein
MEKIYSPNYHARFISQFFYLPNSNPPSPPAPPILFAVIELGIGVYGVGRDRAQAISNASKWIASEPDLRNIPIYVRWLSRGALCLCRITLRYAAEIEQRSNGCPVYVPYQIDDDGVFDLAAAYDRGKA